MGARDVQSLPFTVEQFFDVFSRYNTAIWPTQWLLLAAALIILLGAMSRHRVLHQTALVGSGGLWAWMAAGYHFAFFTAINPAAYVFAAIFAFEAAVLVWAAITLSRGARRPSILQQGLALSLIGYALLLYPIIGYAVGHRYPATPTFGAPCPTTIFTLGVLLLLPRLPLIAFVIPILWAVVGTVGAFHLGVPQDYGLTAAALITAVILYRQRHAFDAERRTAPADTAAALLARASHPKNRAMSDNFWAVTRRAAARLELR